VVRSAGICYALDTVVMKWFLHLRGVGTDNSREGVPWISDGAAIVSIAPFLPSRSSRQSSRKQQCGLHADDVLRIASVRFTRIRRLARLPLAITTVNSHHSPIRRRTVPRRVGLIES